MAVPASPKRGYVLLSLKDVVIRPLRDGYLEERVITINKAADRKSGIGFTESKDSSKSE